MNPAKNEREQTLFDSDLLPKISQTRDEIRRCAQTHCLQGLKDGESGIEVLKCLKQYTNMLLRQVRRRLVRHSKYFLLHHFRRLRVPIQLWLEEQFNWEHDSYEDFLREKDSFSWLFHRLTLSALKYGNSHAKDMQILPPRAKETSGYSVPNQLTDEDIMDLYTAFSLMSDYEEARYCMKRAGKGGKFRWVNRDRLEFDVVLEPKVQKLVEILDLRAATIGNLLSFSGTWASTRVGYEFPLPGNEFMLIHPWPKQTVLTGALSLDTPIILTLVPNIAGQGKGLGWRIPGTEAPLEVPPPWLFQWLCLDSMLPRVELFCSVMKKHLELFGRPSYEPEDLIFTLSAITQCQIRSCLKNDVFWYQIFSYGFQVWTKPYELLEKKVLPEFQNLKKKYMGISPSDGDWDRVKSVIEDIKWNEKKYKQINILRFSPINLIFPIDENTWLIDWSLMLALILDLSSAYGRMIGTIAILRGRDLEITLVEYLKAHANSMGFTIWWLGHEKGMIRFREKGKRDVDIGIIVDQHLLIIDVKAHAATRDLVIIGEPGRLKRRWKTIMKDLKQVDTLCKRLLKEPKGKNFEVPDSVKWIVPIVCGPFTEWVPSSSQKWWLYEDIPRVLTPDELLETIARAKNGDFPQYRLPC
ncbi:hypothetical protein ES703_38137 [subsurface metagenome]